MRVMSSYPSAILPHGLSNKQRYRLKAERSGREFTASNLQEGKLYTDPKTGEMLNVVAELPPLAPSPSKLPRTPENLQICNHCGELIGRDLSSCPICERRLEPQSI